MSFLTPVWNYVDALVHPAAQQDALTAARHRAFIAPRLLGGLVALASVPAYLALRGGPGALEVGVFGWLAAPILVVWFLSRTGRYEGAHALSSLALTGLVTTMSWGTGGLASFAATWLAAVPLEASLSASHRAVGTASAFALAAAALLFLCGAAGLLPAPATAAGPQGVLAVLGIVAASLYAFGLAYSAGSLARTNVRLLRAEEDRYRLLARNMTDVMTRHGRNGAVLFVSPAAEQLFGTRAGELMGHGLFDRVHVADRPAYLKALADAALLEDGCSVEFRVRHGETHGRQDRFLWLEMRCRPLAGDVADAFADKRDVVAVLRDVSERKRQEEALEFARNEVERANATKSHFLATVSHELRTPLNAIIGFSDLLASETFAPDTARRIEYGLLINESGRHLLSIVNGILDMAKMESGNFEITPEPFAPGEVIAGCCDLLALRARDAGVVLATRIAADLPEMTADRRALSQILINLIANAIKFTPRGGKVTVGAAASKTRIAIVVEDTGVGVDEDDLPRLGEAFFQARASYDRRHDGTGLGLSIVKGLVDLHGGTLEIASRLGEGTSVSVRLPIDCEGAQAAQPVARLPHRAAASNDVRTLQVKKIA